MSNFIGTPGNDTLIGTSGNDNLDGGQGADTMSGLAGNDVYMVDNVGDVVIEATDQGIDRVNSTISYTLGPNVEDLWLVGSLATSGTGNELDNVMWGNAANNNLTGLEGNDVLDGGAGADTLIGGTGDDTYWVDNIGDVVIELAGQGNDTVKSTLANYTLGANLENLILLSGAGNINGTGNEQNNEITGNEGNNVLVGGAGNDTLDGGAGADTLTGGTGDDSYRVDNVGDVIIELAGEGNDTVTSTAGSYTLPANVENLTLGTFGGSTENLNGYGNELDNTLRGNSGNNILVGGAGNDTLIGGSGNDTLTGGSGNDLFYFSTEDTGTDTITDLASGDVIEICGALFLEGQVTAGSGAAVVSGQVQLEVVGNQTILHIGVDAAPGADLSIKLDGVFDPGNFHLSGFDIRYDTNHEPTLLNPILDQSATGGTTFSLQLPSDTFSDMDGDTLTYSAMVVDPDWGYLPLPNWLHFNAETRTFSGTPGSADAGELTVSVLATDSHDATTSSSFQLSIKPQPKPVNHPPEGSLIINGNAAQGQVLTAINNVMDADGLGSSHYQWQAGGVDIAGATAATLVLTEAQVGKAITVAVSYTDGLGTAETVASAASSVVANVNDAPTGSVTITGVPSLGQVLAASNTIADADGLGTISYQWSAGGVAVSGATSGTFVLTAAQVGKAITVTALYTDGHGTHESLSSTPTNMVVDLTGPVVSHFSPADEATSVRVDSNIAVTFDELIQRGTGNIVVKTAAGTTVASYDAATSANLSITGNALTINPSSDLGIFTSYRIEIPTNAIRDMAGNSYVGVSDYNFSTQSLDSLYHFCVVAFSAAPGVEYMSQMADAYNAGLSVKEIVNIFTTKPQFTATYPGSMANADFATLLVANVVKNSASEATKAQAIADIDSALSAGWTRGDVIYQVFGNLASMSPIDVAWGNAALQFQNQTAVARYFTETLHSNTTDMPTLRAVIGSVDSHTDVSSPEQIATLIGVELGHPV